MTDIADSPRPLGPSAAGASRVKGIAFRTNAACFEQMYPGRLHEVLNRCSSELSEGLRYSTILATGWYPVQLYCELLSRLAAASGRPADEFTRELGRRAAKRDISGVYKALVKLLKPATLLSLYARLFSNYYSAGKLVVEADRKDYARILLRDCEGFDRNMFMEILGSAEQYLELTGAKGVQVKLVGGGQDGSTHATYEGSWK